MRSNSVPTESSSHKSVTVATLQAAPFGVRSCNSFLGRFHDVKVPVPTTDLEIQLARTFGSVPRPTTTVAYDKKTLVGVATAWVSIPLMMTAAHIRGREAAIQSGRNTRALTFMAVDPAYRRQGLGRQLVKLLEYGCRADDVQTIFGFAEDLPDPSWPFYERLGYTIHHSTEILYFDGIPNGQTPGRQGRLFRKELA